MNPLPLIALAGSFYSSMKVSKAVSEQFKQPQTRMDAFAQATGTVGAATLCFAVPEISAPVGLYLAGRDAYKNRDAIQNNAVKAGSWLRETFNKVREELKPAQDTTRSKIHDEIAALEERVAQKRDNHGRFTRAVA